MAGDSLNHHRLGTARLRCHLAGINNTGCDLTLVFSFIPLGMVVCGLHIVVWAVSFLQGNPGPSLYLLAAPTVKTENIV